MILAYSICQIASILPLRSEVGFTSFKTYSLLLARISWKSPIVKSMPPPRLTGGGIEANITFYLQSGHQFVLPAPLIWE